MSSVFENFKMYVRSCGHTCGTTFCNYLSLRYGLTCGYIKGTAVSIQCRKSATMVDNNIISISAGVPSCNYNSTGLCRIDICSVSRINIKTGMGFDFSCYGMNTSAIG